MSRWEQQIAFLLEIDKMKSIYRQTWLLDCSNRETDAEHSWHLAVAAALLAEYAPEADVFRVIRMVLVHDLVEIDAGDTFAYDTEGYKDKAQREQRAADRLFAILPAEQGAELRQLWEEFEQGGTPDADYAIALDRLMPFLSNAVTGGQTWKHNRVSAHQVKTRMAPVFTVFPMMREYVESVLAKAVAEGTLLP